MADDTMADNQVAVPLIDRRYRIVSKLGEGGFASVFLVEDSWFGDRRLALKVLLKQHQQDPDFERRFRDEIDVLRSLRHPGISEIINDGRTASGEFYFTMDFVDGVTLDALLKAEAPLEPARVVRFVHQLLDVLEAAEERRVVHRDLKPKNIMVERAGTPEERFRVLDFGIAKVVGPRSDSRPDSGMTRGVIGTPDYLAPEQIRGQTLDTRTDLYALGIILHQMLSGSTPFAGATSEERMAARLVAPPRPLPPGIPAPLRTLVAALLRIDREKRPTPREARLLIGEGRRSRRPVLLAGGVLIVAALVAGAIQLVPDGKEPATDPINDPTIVPNPVPVPPDTNSVNPSDPKVVPSGDTLPKPEPKPPDPRPSPVIKEYTFSTYPGFAEVYVDGEAQNSNEGGYFTRSLSAGEHRFRVRADGAEFDLTYTVTKTDTNDKLVIDYARGIVRPPGR